MAERLKDPMYRAPMKDPRSLGELDYYSRAHSLLNSVSEGPGSMAVRINRALRDKRIIRPGKGRWVEYILPDLRRVYIEANLRKAYLGKLDDAQITARVIVKAGGTEYTNSLEGLILMGMAQVTGDLVDVVRTADLIGLSVTDPDTRSIGGVSGHKPIVREKMASLVSKAMRKEADYVDSERSFREVKYALSDMARQGSMESIPVRDKAPKKTVRSFVLERYQDGGTYLDKWTLTQTGKTEATIKRTGMLTMEEPPKLTKKADHIDAQSSGRTVYYMLQDMASERDRGSSSNAVQSLGNPDSSTRVVLTDRYAGSKILLDKWVAKKKDKNTLVIRHRGVTSIDKK